MWWLCRGRAWECAHVPSNRLHEIDRPPPGPFETHTRHYRLRMSLVSRNDQIQHIFGEAARRGGTSKQTPPHSDISTSFYWSSSAAGLYIRGGMILARAGCNSPNPPHSGLTTNGDGARVRRPTPIWRRITEARNRSPVLEPNPYPLKPLSQSGPHGICLII